MLNIYIDNEWYLCMVEWRIEVKNINDTEWIYRMWEYWYFEKKFIKRYKVNKEGLFEEVTN